IGREGMCRLASDLGVCLRYAVQGGSSKLLAIAEPQDSKSGFAQLGSLLEHSREYRLDVAGRGIDDLQYFGGGGLPRKGLLQFAGENADLLLQIGNGWACSRARLGLGLGLGRTPPLYRLLASTTSSHCARLGCITIKLKLIQLPGFMPWQEVRFEPKSTASSMVIFGPPRMWHRRVPARDPLK